MGFCWFWGNLGYYSVFVINTKWPLVSQACTKNYSRIIRKTNTCIVHVIHHNPRGSPPCNPAPSPPAPCGCMGKFAGCGFSLGNPHLCGAGAKNHNPRPPLPTPCSALLLSNWNIKGKNQKEFGQIRWKIRKFFRKKKNSMPRINQNPKKLQV